jgi:hypothetical protein
MKPLPGYLHHEKMSLMIPSPTISILFLGIGELWI